jgi:hypothetical protein
MEILLKDAAGKDVTDATVAVDYVMPAIYMIWRSRSLKKSELL